MNAIYLFENKGLEWSEWGVKRWKIECMNPANW